MNRYTPKYPQDQKGGISIVTFEKPLVVQRFFTINGVKGIKRGNHAHKKCTQTLIALSGMWKLETRRFYKNSENLQVETFSGNTPFETITVEPGIWLTIDPLTDGGQIMVLCDMPYDVNDYIHSYQEFRKLYFNPTVW